MLHRRQGYKNRGQLKATAGNVLTITGCFCSIFSVNSTIAGQNVFFGGGGPTWKSEPREVWGKPPGKFLKFSFLKSHQMHPILKTSSYIWGTHLLLLFSLHLSIGGGGYSPRGPFPSYGTGQPL